MPLNHHCFPEFLQQKLRQVFFFLCFYFASIARRCLAGFAVLSARRPYRLSCFFMIVPQTAIFMGVKVLVDGSSIVKNVANII